MISVDMFCSAAIACHIIFTVLPGSGDQMFVLSLKTSTIWSNMNMLLCLTSN